MPRARVYGALDYLKRRALVRPTATVPSDVGPQRTILEISESGAVALDEWLVTPVERVRDVRSLLMLKLLFLMGRGQDAAPLLIGERQVFRAQADRLTATAESATGSDRALLLWRLHSTKAVIEFTDAMLSDLVAAANIDYG
jgi:DNA-binding PadR family transcriptional regulator